MSKIGKATFGLIIVTMISKILGFGRELALTYVYGASEIADAYITAVSIPGVLFASIGATLATIFIPLFYEVDKLKGKSESLKFSNNILNIVLILSAVLVLFSFIFIEPLVKIFAISFTGEKLQITIKFAKVIIFGVTFIGLSNIMTAWLQMNGNFNVPGMIGIPYNILIIGGVLLSSKGNVSIMIIGTLLGIASQFFFQLPFAIKYGYRYKVYINLKDVYIKKMMLLIVPVFIGSAVNQINSVVDRSLASTLGDGIITVLNSANRLNSFVLGIFIVTITAVVYPILSRLSNENNRDQFVQSIANSINLVILLIIPISVGSIILSEPIVRVVFERGAFSSDATIMTSIALKCYSIGILGFGLREVLNKVFYSLQDTKTPMINGVLAVGFNIVLNFIFIKSFGYAGLALATSLAGIVCIILLFISLKKKIGYFGQDKIIKTMVKSLISSSIMGIVTIVAYKLLDNMLDIGFIQDAIALFGSIGVGAIVYIGLTLILKVEEVNLITNRIKAKICR